MIVLKGLRLEVVAGQTKSGVGRKRQQTFGVECECLVCIPADADTDLHKPHRGRESHRLVASSTRAACLWWRDCGQVRAGCYW